MDFFTGSSMGLSYLDWSSIAAARSDENCKVPILIFVFCICVCVCICTSVNNSRHPPFVRHIHCDISHIDLVIQNIQYVQKMCDAIHNKCSMYQSMLFQLSHRPINKMLFFEWKQTSTFTWLGATTKLRTSFKDPEQRLGHLWENPPITHLAPDNYLRANRIQMDVIRKPLCSTTTTRSGLWQIDK